MNSIKKVLIAVAIILALAVIYLLWNTPDSSTIKTIEAVRPTRVVTEPIIEQTTVEETTKPSIKTVQDAKDYVEDYASRKGYDINDYPEKLFELMIKDELSIEYVLDYPSEINKEHNAKLELDSFDEIPLLIQWDTRWGYHQFKNGIVGIDGCGATCLSMAVVYLNQDTGKTPDVVADFVSNNGYFVNGSGTSWNLFDKGVEHFGLKSRTLAINKDSLVNAVQSGHPVVLSVREGDFTKKGHYIVIAGYENDRFIINDPYSVVNSEKTWKWDRIKPQIKNMWEIYK